MDLKYFLVFPLLSMAIGMSTEDIFFECDLSDPFEMVIQCNKRTQHYRDHYAENTNCNNYQSNPTKITFHDCHMTTLPNILSTDLHRFTDVRTINISGMGLDSLNGFDHLHFQQLKELIAYENKFQQMYYYNIFDGISLEFLDLAFNQFTEISSIRISRTTALKILILSHNQIGTLNMYTFNELTNLEVLKLSYNPLQNLEIGVFDELKNLQRLSLAFTNLSHIDFVVFSPLINLHSLDISGNQIKKIDIGMHMAAFNQLAEIDISGNYIFEINEFSKAMFPSLMRLDLRGNHFNCSYLPKLLSSFDNLKLEVDSSSMIAPGKSYRGIACQSSMVKDEPILDRSTESSLDVKAPTIFNSETTMENVPNSINEDVRNSLLELKGTIHTIYLIEIFSVLIFIMSLAIVLYAQRDRIIVQFQQRWTTRAQKNSLKLDDDVESVI